MALTAAAGLAGGAPRWLRVESGRFEIYTTAGERPARAILNHLELGHRVFRDWPLPVRVYLFATENEFRRYRQADSSGGFFQSGPVRDLIALPYRGPESLKVVMHEFIHLVLSHSAPVTPRWLEEGTAEFYSTLHASGTRALVGGTIRAYLIVLNSSRWLDADQLARVERDSPEYNEPSRVGLFYAQSWALTHMLHLAPGYREHMPRYIEQLRGGPRREEAFEAAFGKTLAAALQDLRGYVKSWRFGEMEIEAGPRAEEPAVRIQPIEGADAERALSELALRAGRKDDTEKLYRQLARAKTESPENEARLGLAALTLGRDEEALAHLGRAIQLGGRDAEVYFEYAMLLRDKGGDRAEVAANLGRAVALNPNYAEAHFLLGLMASSEKRPVEALEHFKRAAEILPRQSQFWHALALAAHEAGDATEARRAARRARQSAATPREIEMAEAALRLVETPAP
jgi:tetratricopeptide (TPR) repeat protein